MSLKLFKNLRQEPNFEEIFIFGGFQKTSDSQSWMVFEKFELYGQEDPLVYVCLFVRSISDCLARSYIGARSQPRPKPTKPTKARAPLYITTRSNNTMELVLEPLGAYTPLLCIDPRVFFTAPPSDAHVRVRSGSSQMGGD